MVQRFGMKIFTAYAEVPGSIPGRCTSTCSTVVVAQHLYDSFLPLKHGDIFWCLFLHI